MNIPLDQLLRRLVSEPVLRESARADPQAVAECLGVPVADMTAALECDLRALHVRGAHPLLIMKLASAMGMNPMEQLRGSDPPGPLLTRSEGDTELPESQ